MADEPSYADLAFGRSVDEVDPYLAELTRREHTRQRDKLIMIPSESLTPKPVREALASPFTSIYAEGYPAGPMLREDESGLEDLDWQLARFRRYGDRRYYRGNDYTNLVEALARRRCAELFATDRVSVERLQVNVQPLSGAAANNAIYEALLEPGDTIMGLALAHGGHLSHGAAVNRSGRRFGSVSYSIASADARLDYDQIAEIAEREQPRIIVAGYTSYPWAPDWEKFREIADGVDAYLLADISHPAGLVVAGAYPSPVGIADIVSFTTHKTLFGPRGAVILSHRQDLMRLIDRSVFPGEQGGPHLNKIAAMAVAFRLAATPAFHHIQRQIVANAATLAQALESEGVGLAYGGTDTHLMVLNLRAAGASGDLRGEPAVRMLDLLGIVANRNSLPGDRGFAAPTGVRVGTPWLTQRGYRENDMRALATLFARAFRAMTGVHYPGKRDVRHRGRIEYGEFAKVRAELRDFARRGRSEAAAATETPKRAALIEIRGARSAAFVDQLANRRTRDLAAGRAVHVGIAGAGGAAVHSALVFRPDNRQGRERRYWLVVDSEEGPELASWLQAVSDGYVAIDAEERGRKVTGPVSVTIGPAGAEPLDAITVSVADALLVARMDGDGVARLEFDGHAAWVVVAGEAAAVVAEAAALPEVEAALAKHDVARAPLPPAPQPDLRRPYFVGRAAHLNSEAPPAKPAFAWEEPEGATLRETPLHSFHREHAKKLISFGGWDMPVWYTSIEAEHRAVRRAAGLFDVGHMGVLSIAGPHAAEFLDTVVTGNASRLPPGRAAYTFLLDPTGNCLDDLIIYRLEPERFLAVVNAANAEKDWAWLSGVNERRYEIVSGDSWAERPVAAELENLHDPASGDRQRLDLALQGPKSRTVLLRIADGEEDCRTLRAMRPNDIRLVTLAGVSVEIAHTGYTGEPVGFEIFVHPDMARDVWDAILTAGAEDGVVPTGLGARDSTRTQAGFPLYGHELAGPLGLTPGDAGFGQFVKVYKPFFIGRDAFLERERERRAQIVRFRVTAERAPLARQGDPVVDARGNWVGAVTSAGLTAAGRQIGMAHVDSRHAADGAVLGVFAGATARTGRRSVAPAELSRGGRYPLPVEAKIISRFRG